MCAGAVRRRAGAREPCAYDALGCVALCFGHRSGGAPIAVFGSRGAPPGAPLPPLEAITARARAVKARCQRCANKRKEKPRAPYTTAPLPFEGGLARFFAHLAMLPHGFQRMISAQPAQGGLALGYYQRCRWQLGIWVVVDAAIHRGWRTFGRTVSLALFKLAHHNAALWLQTRPLATARGPGRRLRRPRSCRSGSGWFYKGVGSDGA